MLFNIVAFNNRNYIWQKKLVPASDENKNNANYFVAALTLANGTASYDALDAALQFDAESIYFLTDGAPVGGRITSPPDIIRAINRDNQFRRMTVNSLGIGVGLPGNTVRHLPVRPRPAKLRRLRARGRIAPTFGGNTCGSVRNESRVNHRRRHRRRPIHDPPARRAGLRGRHQLLAVQGRRGKNGRRRPRQRALARSPSPAMCPATSKSTP